MQPPLNRKTFLFSQRINSIPINNHNFGIEQQYCHKNKSLFLESINLEQNLYFFYRLCLVYEYSQNSYIYNLTLCNNFVHCNEGVNWARWSKGERCID